MKNDPDLIKTIEVGSVIQISPEGDPEAFNKAFRGSLAVVDKKESWGVVVSVIWGGLSYPTRLTWSHIEPTGGRAVWDADGKRLRPPASTTKHHP